MSKVDQALFLLLIASSPVAGNVVRRLSLKEKVSCSPIIFTGRVAATHEVLVGKSAQRYASVEVLSSLRGESEGNAVTVLYDGPIGEANPLCCENGADYLFFLKERKDGNGGRGLLESTNGPYGVFRVQEGYIDGWDEKGTRIPLATAVREIATLLGDKR